jgi:nucleotide-binding universal stress UspA family protein
MAKKALSSLDLINQIKSIIFDIGKYFTMINILVPTDFSELSKVAIRFAIRLANKIDANITLLYVITIPQTSRASIRMKIKKLEQEFFQMGNEDLQILVDEFSPMLKTTKPLAVRIIKGTSFNESVKKEAKKLRSGLIVMGTRGASGITKYIMGSNTTSVIDVSQIPVLVIPELGTFKNFRNVVYATDMKHTDKELKMLIPYLKMFESIVHVVHVTPSLKQVTAIEKKLDSAVSKAGLNNVIVRVIVNKYPQEALDHYVSTVKADLITTFTHEHGFYDKVFQKSLTRKMAFQSKIPLLAFKEKS